VHPNNFDMYVQINMQRRRVTLTIGTFGVVKLRALHQL